MAKAKTWYVVTNRAGRELFLHELFVDKDNGFDCEVYTPFEKKMQHYTSRLAKKNRKPPEEYAEALFRGFLFVGSDLSHGEALMSIDYIVSRRSDAYGVLTHMGEPFMLSDAMMDNWKAQLAEKHKKRRNFVIRGYDPKRDRKKNQTRMFGQDAVEVPKFDKGDIVKFTVGGFRGISADVTGFDSDGIDLLVKIFGQEHVVRNVDPYELQKVG